MKKKTVFYCVFFVFLAFCLVVGSAERAFGDISDGILRLHIIANSDADIDQTIKLTVRDEVISAQKDIFTNGVKKVLNKEEKEKILKITQKVLEENSVSYSAKIDMGEFYFPTKKYDNITLPAGRYRAVRIVLGEGEGKNWWCVMYPPLCFCDSYIGRADNQSLDALKKSMGEREYEIISDENIKLVPAFKLIESIQIIKEKIKNPL